LLDARDAIPGLQGGWRVKKERNALASGGAEPLGAPTFSEVTGTVDRKSWRLFASVKRSNVIRSVGPADQATVATAPGAAYRADLGPTIHLALRSHGNGHRTLFLRSAILVRPGLPYL